MEDHQHAERKQGLQGVEQHEAVAFLQSEKDHTANKRKKIAQRACNIIRQSGG